MESLKSNDENHFLFQCAEIVINSLKWLHDTHLIRLCGFVIMPNHYHVILGLGKKKTLSEVMENTNKYSARQINKFLKRRGRFWEEGFYDHCMHSRADFEKFLFYVHSNPVKAGLIEKMELWPYSTAHPQYSHLIDVDWLGFCFEQ